MQNDGFEGNKAVCVWKSHHCLGDGISCISLIECLSEHYDPNNFIKIKTPAWY